MAKGHEGTANRLRRHWRKRIMTRDYGACSTGCIDAPYPEELLQVAHITSAYEFRRAFGDELGTEASFRDDNLILLCEVCHVVHTDMEFGRIRPLSQHLKPFLDKEEQRAIETGEDLRDQVWFSKRRDLVARLMERLTVKRGWTTVEDFSRIHGMPNPKPVPEPPKPTDSGDYPAGSTISWTKLPVGYSDVRKALLHVFRERHVETLAEGHARDFIAYYESFEIQRR
jgi:hypothetical protein